MSFIKRIFLLVLTNILVMLTIGVLIFALMSFFPALRGYGYGQIMVLATVWGFGGAFISLLLSKWMAKTFNGVQVIDPATATGDARWSTPSAPAPARTARWWPSARGYCSA